MSSSLAIMELQFVTLDVFTNAPYGGNPLALVLVPPSLSSTLTQTQKQTIAREFNLSETAFLHLNSSPPSSSSPSTKEPPQWRLDIFMTNQELPFAGHPTIGAAWYVMNVLLADSSHTSATLNTKSGPISISRVGENGSGAVSASISHKVHIHSRTLADVSAEVSSKALSSNSVLKDLEIKASTVSIVKGMNFLCIPVPDLQTLALATTDGKGVKAGESGLLDEGWNAGFVGRLYYCLLHDEGGKEDGVVRVRTRMMEANFEDPATGSASCALGAYLALNGVGVAAGGNGAKYAITQGVEMGRRSEIGVEVGLKEGGKAVERVKLSGSAVKVMEGKLTI